MRIEPAPTSELQTPKPRNTRSGEHKSQGGILVAVGNPQ